MVKPGLSASPAVAAVRASSSEPCKPSAAASAKWVRGELRPQCFVGTSGFGIRTHLYLGHANKMHPPVGKDITGRETERLEYKVVGKKSKRSA
jgi:hypothetical protein